MKVSYNLSGERPRRQHQPLTGKAISHRANLSGFEELLSPIRLSSTPNLYGS